MEIYIRLGWNGGFRIQKFTVETGFIYFYPYFKTVCIPIEYSLEYHNYIKNTCLQIQPKMENLIKLPLKIRNTIKLPLPKERYKVYDQNGMYIWKEINLTLMSPFYNFAKDITEYLLNLTQIWK